MDMRDKHVAHAVNPFDQVRVGAVLSPVDSAKREVIGTAQFRQQLMGWNHDGLRSLEHLTRAAHAFAIKRFAKVEAELFEEIRSTPIDDLYQRPTLSFVTPSPDDARRSRP